MTLYFIGIGLRDEKDITLRGLEIVKRCKHIYLESYTSILQCPIENLESLYEKKITLADRSMVERGANEILDEAKYYDVAFLVIGDIFGATTHTDLLLRAQEKDVKCEFVHNASILNATGVVGLELYKFGKTTSIPFPSKGFEPRTPYDVIKMNKDMGLHTLVLLDLRPSEGKFMTVNEAVSYLLSLEEKIGEGVFSKDTLCVGCARIGADFTIKAGAAKDLVDFDFGKPLHCLIIPGKMHFIEEDALKLWK